jgi:hypothetical protein
LIESSLKRSGTLGFPSKAGRNDLLLTWNGACFFFDKSDFEPSSEEKPVGLGETFGTP